MLPRTRKDNSRGDKIFILSESFCHLNNIVQDSSIKISWNNISHMNLYFLHTKSMRMHGGHTGVGGHPGKHQNHLNKSLFPTILGGYIWDMVTTGTRASAEELFGNVVERLIIWRQQTIQPDYSISSQRSKFFPS